MRGVPPLRSRRGPRLRRPAKLHADKSYDYDHLRRWLRKSGSRHRIARKGIASSTQLGRDRWVVEKTVPWLTGRRRPHRHYERKPEHFLAFVGTAATLISHRGLTERNSVLGSPARVGCSRTRAGVEGTAGDAAGQPHTGF